MGASIAPVPEACLTVDTWLPAETIDLVAALDQASDEHAASLRPKNTTDAYAADFNTWHSFLATMNGKLKDQGLEPIPANTASRGLLRAFVQWLWTEQKAAPSTIDRRIAGVTVTLRREHQVVVNPDDVKAAREYLRDLQREAAPVEAKRGRGQSAPLLLEDLRKACAACPDSLTGLRDRALLLLAFSIAGRRSEVAGLRARDIVEDSNGLVVTVRVSKTKEREVAVPYGGNPVTCPVRAWRSWRDAAGLDGDSPAFLRIDRHGRVLGGLSGAAAGAVITRAHERVQVADRKAAEKRGEEFTGKRMTGHSARAGLATTARQKGKSLEAISATTGHAAGSRSLAEYIRRVDRWAEDENALVGIGL